MSLGHPFQILGHLGNAAVKAFHHALVWCARLYFDCPTVSSLPRQCSLGGMKEVALKVRTAAFRLKKYARPRQTHPGGLLARTCAGTAGTRGHVDGTSC